MLGSLRFTPSEDLKSKVYRQVCEYSNFCLFTLLGEEDFPEISSKSDARWCKEMIYLHMSSIIAR
jgi:hypothetical protein